MKFETKNLLKGRKKRIMATMMNAQPHTATIWLETELISVRSNLSLNNMSEYGNLRKSNTKSSGLAYSHLKRSV